MPSDLARRIRAAVLKSLTVRNRYTDPVTAQLTRSLDQAEKEVAKAILTYRTLGSLPDNKPAVLPFHTDHTPQGIDELATKVFTVFFVLTIDLNSCINLVSPKRGQSASHNIFLDIDFSAGLAITFVLYFASFPSAEVWSSKVIPEKTESNLRLRIDCSMEL